jgi:hypothetical protein
MTPPATAPRRRGRRWLRGFAVEISLMALIAALGALTLLPIHWSLAAVEVAAMAVSPLWMMLRVCPHCTVHGSDACPSGFGVISDRLVERRDTRQFAEAFAHNVYGVMPMWFLPVAGVAYMLYAGIDVPVVPFVAFAVMAFVVTPLRARFHHCKRCPRRADCPWAIRTMGPVTRRPNGNGAPGSPKDAPNDPANEAPNATDRIAVAGVTR